MFSFKVYLNGYHGDCSTMFQIGEVDSEGKRLIKITELCLKEAVQICKPNERFCNIGSNVYIKLKILVFVSVIVYFFVESFHFFLGNVIEEIANKHNLNVIPVCLGHGIGTYFHGAPDIFHFGIH